jgi:hypothetical protein
MKTILTAALRLLVVSAALAPAVLPAAAQTQTTPPAPSPTALHVKTKRLLELTGASKLGMQMIDGMMQNFKGALPNVPDEFWTTFRAKVKADDLVEMVIPIYEKHLTEEDVDGLIAFFSSPVGRRFVEKQPLILADSMKVGEAWGAKLADQVLSDLRAKGYESKNQE